VYVGAWLRQMSQVNFFSVVVPNKTDAVFEDGHPSQAEQVDFDKPQISAIILVPLNDDSPGHGRGFERNDGIQLALANDHSAGVLTEMARQVLHSPAEIEIHGNLRMT